MKSCDNVDLLLNHGERISHVEAIQKIHAAMLEKQSETISTISTNLGGITKSINQIKWVGLGAASAYYLAEKGLVEFLKKVIL